MTRRKPQSRVEFLEREQQVWDELNSLVAGLPAKTLRAPGAAGAWSVKDVWGHIAVWMERTRKVVPSMLKGEKIKADIQAFNDEQYSAIREMSVTEARNRLTAERKRFLSFVKRLPEKDLIENDQVYNWVSFSCFNHYAEHIPGFTKFRESIEPSATKER